MDNPENPAT